MIRSNARLNRRKPSRFLSAISISTIVLLASTGCRSTGNIHSLGIDELEGEELSFLDGAGANSTVLPKKCRRFNNGNIDGNKVLVLVNKGEFTIPNSTAEGTFQNQLPASYQPPDL